MATVLLGSAGSLATVLQTFLEGCDHRGGVWSEDTGGAMD
jgi:hypothetical protein